MHERSYAGRHVPAQSASCALCPRSAADPYGRLTNVLVIGPNSAWRFNVAEAIHRQSPLRQGVLVRIDGYRECDRLIRALCGLPQPGSEVHRVLAATRGTLFVDRVECLSLQAQSLLLGVAVGDIEARDMGEDWRPGRLVTGMACNPTAALRRGLLMPDLYDALDKIRTEWNPGHASGCPHPAHAPNLYARVC